MFPKPTKPTRFRKRRNVSSVSALLSQRSSGPHRAVLGDDLTAGREREREGHLRDGVGEGGCRGEHPDARARSSARSRARGASRLTR